MHSSSFPHIEVTRKSKFKFTSDRMSGLSLEEYDLLGDSKYRAYVASVDKTLRNFENTSEWADLISTLGKLNKVLLSHMKYPVVPRRITISKRLAQCMHPALPSGVHLKALETYDIIFKCMGTNRLSQELFIYSAGLFPLFSSAAMNVRSALLTVYETRFVPLGPRLRPGLNGFLSGILAGLEEGSDHLERTSQLLSRVAEGVGQAEFFGCLWDCVWGNSGVRLPAISHIMACYNKKLSTEDQLYILGTNIDITVSALCQAMEDSSVMVQRAALDLTLAALPMHNTQLLQPDLVRIVTSAILVLLRRDMSLNRRLYAWLLGSEINLSLLSSEHPVVKRLNSAMSDTNTEDGAEINAYFETFSRPLLVEGIIACLRASQGTNPPDLRPYRLIVSLLDKPEIGPYILDNIFLDLLRCLYHTCQVLQISNEMPAESSSRRQSTIDKQNSTLPLTQDGAKVPYEGNRGFHEITKTATLLFSALQPSYPWMHLTGLLSQACLLKATSGNKMEEEKRHNDIDYFSFVKAVGNVQTSVCEVCTLLQHLLTSLPLDTQQQTQASRLPEVLSSVTSLLTEHLTVLNAHELSVGLSLCQSILHKLIPSVTLPPVSNLSRPESRASIGTFASLQLHGLSQVTTVTRSLVVPEAAARESPPTESGIVQIGIEANELDVSQSEENQNLGHSSGTSVTRDSSSSSNLNENLTDVEAETSFISNCSKLLANDIKKSEMEIESDTGKSKEPGIDENDFMNDDIFSMNPNDPVDLFEINEMQNIDRTESKFLEDYKVLIGREEDMGGVAAHQELSRIQVSQEASEDEYESAPQSPNHHASSPIHNYVKDFEKFFLEFIQKKIISNKSSIVDFQNVLYRSDMFGIDSLSELKYLLKECLQCCEAECGSKESPVVGKQRSLLLPSQKICSTLSRSTSPVNSNSKNENIDFSSFLQLDPKSNEQLRVFKVSCNILVDLSSLPTTPGLALTRPSANIPQWLVGLLACVVCGNQVSPEFTLTSVSTLLELVMLAQSELSVWQNESALGGDGDAGVVTVNITPLLLPTHTHILLYHTLVYQHTARQLWSYLRPNTSHFHVTSTELLIQLHNLTLPHGSSATLTSAPPQSSISIVERQILLALTCPVQISSAREKIGVVWSHEGIRAEYNSKSMQQWMTLWQVSRTLSSGFSGKRPGFDRCLFLMVERLRGDSGIERSLAHAWLATALQRSDTARLIDPILVLLLHPHTRRVSVQHVNIEKLPPTQQCQGNKCIIEESQIYAISSEGGEVMYHVSKEGRQPQTRGKPISTPAKHILAFTSISKDSKRVVTHHADFTEFELPSSHEQPQLQSSISLMVNPFMQHPWIDMEDLAKMNKPLNLSNAVRIQNGNYQKSPTTNFQDDLNSDASPARFHDDDDTEDDDDEEWTPAKMIKSILEDVIDAVVSSHHKYPESDGSSEQDTISQSITSDGNIPELTRHPFHSHMLLYMQVVDSGQCLNGLLLIRNIIEAQPKNSLLALASTSINTLQSTSPLIILLARHRRSVFGDGFDGGNVTDMVSQFRSTMYLQVVITVCLYYLRSYYPCLPHLRLRDEHLQDNQEVQVASAEVLILIFTHLSPLVTDSPRGFTPYITDLLSKCKVQKCVLHCLLSTVHAMTSTGAAVSSEQKLCVNQETRTFTEEVLDYNCGYPGQSGTIPHQETYLARIIDLTLALVRLEDTLATDRADSGGIRDPPSVSMKYSGFSATKYQPGQPIPAQPMFMEVLTVALKQHHLRHLHGSWLHLFTAALPHMGPSLPNNSLRVTYLVCELLECMAHYYFPGAPSPQAPPDYTLTLLQCLTMTVHYCLLDPTQSPAFGSSSSTSTSVVSPTSQSAGQILYNLLHVFSPVGEIMDAPVDSSGLDPPACARHTILCHLPRIISSLLSLWAATGDDQESAFVLGSRRGVRQQIVELLSPICHHQTPHLLAAVSVVWQGIGIAATEASISPSNNGNNTHNKQSGVGGLLWSGCPQQLALVEMMALLRVLPLHTLVATVKQVVKQPPIVDGSKQTLPLEVSVLQVFYVYVQQCPGSQLGECWGSLLTMVKEGTLSLTPPAQLLLLATLNEFVQRASLPQEKKDIKELQEVSSKLLESCSNIAGSGLEPTTWLRRNLTVKAESFLEKKDGVNDPSVYSVAALSVLAELLAPLLDVLYVSEEKDKVVPLLTNIMAHVVPYLRNHTRNNMPAFAACSQLLSSLSGYQYTVRAWRRDVIDLLLDSQAFMMLPPILTYWRTIVDYLCTHDKSVFKELLSRVSMSQGGSLNLFSSKESEYETRADLLKRLAFTIFCSETDQYMRHIPDIQERLAEVTRLGQVVPSLVAQVLLCFRVLLLRLSPRGVTSLWPVIITELVQVFLMMEQELATDTEQFSKKGGSSHLKRLSTLDSSWVFSSQNGLNAHNHPAWLTLYLSACKLLDLMLALPAQHLPQFQMYRWAFVGPIPTSDIEEKTEGAGSILLKSCDFVPHIARIAKLMADKTGNKNTRTLDHHPGQLMLTVSSISTLVDLQPFFNTLVLPTFTPAAATMGQATSGSHIPFSSSVSSSGSGQTAATSLSSSNFAHIEAVIERDFLEPLPS
ncbi:protein DOP1A isoform X1 [Procambarus clarkii]|uniref:protein DOP1A isoform X1 n=2 Tax=Procambarus clarkii TaxID=6728 RepID=UPI0037424BAA